MLTVIRDSQGRLIAACEWMRRDETGRLHPNGRLIWVEQLELGWWVDSRQVIRQIVDQIATDAPDAVGAYWVRRDKDGGRRTHGFLRRQLLRNSLEEVR